MKKKEKFYPVNNQEDEDGYSICKANAGKKQRLTSARDFENPGTRPGTWQIRRPMLSSLQQSQDAEMMQ
jgi:hypothetical protein